MERTNDGLGVHDLAKVRLGEGPAARLVADIVRAIDPLNAEIGIERIAVFCRVGAWSVYRWLRGTHTPRRRQWDGLREIAAGYGIAVTIPTGDSDEVPTGDSDEADDEIDTDPAIPAIVVDEP